MRPPPVFRNVVCASNHSPARVEKEIGESKKKLTFLAEKNIVTPAK